jgi:hypothetical protein
MESRLQRLTAMSTHLPKPKGEWVMEQLTILAEAMDQSLTTSRLQIYLSDLCYLEQRQLELAFWRARRELKFFPKIAELRELAGVSSVAHDRRPGPEEAWARMPKGERMEADSVVWCEEERIAYGACRTLLLDGDLIGARMAFKERYTQELAKAKSEGKAVTWIASVGYDMEHRLTTLAQAIEENRISVERALDLLPGEKQAEFAGMLPGEKQAEFARMLPAKKAKGLLTGTVQTLPSIPGLAGLLAQMKMDGSLPREITSQPKYEPASVEQIRQRKEVLRKQAQLLKRSA